MIWSIDAPWLLPTLVVALGIVVFVIGARAAYATARSSRELSDAGNADVDLTDRQHDQEFSQLATARRRFNEAVETHERVLAQAKVGGPGESAEVDQARAAKDRARADLIIAQREWEAVQPPDGPTPPVELWFGGGVIAGWQLGPIGAERITIRMNHVIDSACWASWSARRWRFGLGLGAERVSVASFALGASMGDLPALLGRGFGGGELAVRPGFSLVRWLRLRSRNSTVRAAAKSLMADVRHDPTGPPSTRSRKTVDRLFSLELGQDISTVTTLPPVTPQLSNQSGGFSLMLGAWIGRDPKFEPLAHSAHGGWSK